MSELFKIDTIEDMPYLLMVEECTEEYQQDCHLILANMGTKQYAEEILARANRALTYWISPLMKQLEMVDYECEGGKLSDNTEYRRLKDRYDLPI